MPKLKTHKAVVKRFKITKTKKILKKTAGQDHYNSRESGKTTRKKRGLKQIAKSKAKTIRNLLPYS